MDRPATPSLPLSAPARALGPARIAALAVAVGLAAQLLLHGHAPGVNVPIATAVLLVAAAIAAGGVRRTDPLDAWIPLTALLLAAFVAVRDDPPLVALDVAGALALSGASVAAFAGESVTRRTTLSAIELAGRVMAAAGVGGLPLLERVRHDARPREQLTRSGRRAIPVLRGLLLVFPLILVFGALFASADPIFQRWLDRLTAFDVDAGDVLARTAYATFAGWLAGGLLWFAWSASSRVRDAARSLGAAASSPAAAVAGSLRLGVVEAVTILVALDALFAGFVALQLAYLFGGLDTLSAIGMTYSTYARRGFFELVAVVVMVGALLLALEAVVAHRTRAYVAAATVLIALTAVVLASSWLRLGLYQQAYGWTQLRFYVAAAIAFLAIDLVAAALLILGNRARWLPHAVAASALVVLVGVNVLGPQAFITARNLERSIVPAAVPYFGDPSLDAGYLATLGADAIPALVEALPGMTADQRAEVELLLSDAHWRYVVTRADGWQSWNLARERARASLEAWASR